MNFKSLVAASVTGLAAAATTSPIKYIIVLMMENRRRVFCGRAAL